jgi:hypothetical protein
MVSFLRFESGSTGTGNIPDRALSYPDAIVAGSEGDANEYQCVNQKEKSTVASNVSFASVEWVRVLSCVVESGGCLDEAVIS